MPTPTKYVAVIGLAVGMFLAGYMANRRTTHSASPPSARRVLYYTCPMHPQYKSDRPGDAPCCGMRLEPVYADGTSGKPETGPPGAVRIGASRQQLIGVSTELVRRGPASHTVRVLGRVAADEARLYRIIAATDGWIRELGPNTAGSSVKKDQVLATYYTTNLLASAQTFVYALTTNDQTQPGYLGAQRGPTVLSLQIAIDSLRSLGMSELQIEELRKTRQATSEINIYSPISGFVLARNISPAQRFDKGAEMYRIADLSRVWVLADVFENDARLAQLVTSATVRYRGQSIPARLANASSVFDAATRTLKIRLEVDNPGATLRPDMFVDTEFQVSLSSALTVPVDAVLDSGLRKTVFVDRGNGYFEPRRVETGARLGDRLMITSGLAPGERIVVSGNFLIDSESRFRMAAGGSQPAATAAGPAKDPVCGMDVDPAKPGAKKAAYEGKTYYFCSDTCKREFEKNPAKFAPGQPGQDRERTAGDMHGERGPA